MSPRARPAHRPSPPARAGLLAAALLSGCGAAWESPDAAANGRVQIWITKRKGANLDVEKQKAAPSVTLLDPKGEIGKLYAAKTTPHMFVIGKDGKLLYNGAIDDKPTPDQADLASSKNYVAQALTEVLAGKPVSTPTTTPYGCSVKY